MTAMRKHAFWLVPVVLIAAGLIYFKHREPKADKLLLITVDALRADHLSIYGYKGTSTPNLSQLAAKSLVFENAFTTMPTTQPAISSIFTSLYPGSHSVRKNGMPLPEQAITLAEILKKHGWTTAAFVSAFPLDKRFQLNQGFDEYRDSIGTHGRQKNLKYEVDAGQLTKAIVKWLERNKARRNTFLWIHYFDPHAPYQPPRAAGTLSTVDFENNPVSGYDAEIEFLDGQLGILFKALKLYGFKDALTLVVSDHGEGFGEHGYKGHGWFLYDEVIRVALFVSGPGIHPGRATELVQHVDLAPGILDYFGISCPPQFEGISWWKVLQKKIPPRSAVWVERRAPPIANGVVDPEGGTGVKEKWALRTKSEKLIWSSDGNSEYYDLRKDPRETTNLFKTGDPRIMKLEKEGMMRKVRNLQKSLAPGHDIQQEDEEAREALKALGYVN
jgi:arylsulfatase A-like enzyme